MKLTPAQESYSRGKYPILIDGNPGAIELSDRDEDIYVRIYAVSPKLSGSTGEILHGSSANAFIMEIYCTVRCKGLKIEAKHNLMYNQLANLIWNFCVNYKLEVNPSEFDLYGFTLLWFYKS